MALGTIEVHRSVGAEYDLGCPSYRIPIEHWYNYSVNKEGCTCIVLNAYHFSAGHPKLGCAGHNNDREAAKACVERLSRQYGRVFDGDYLYSMVIGHETDTESWVIHDPLGDEIDILKLTEEDLPLEERIRAHFPDMPSQAIPSFTRMLESNLRHSLTMRNTPRPHHRAGHKEVGVMFGRGTEWAMTDKVLKLSPYPLDMAAQLRDAARILWHTFRTKHPAPAMPDEPFVLLTTGVCYDISCVKKQRFAMEEAQALAREGFKHMTARVPEMRNCLEVIPGTINNDTRLFEPIEDFEL